VKPIRNLPFKSHLPYVACGHIWLYFRAYFRLTAILKTTLAVVKPAGYQSYGAGEPGFSCWRFHSLRNVASRSATYAL